MDQPPKSMRLSLEIVRVRDLVGMTDSASPGQIHSHLPHQPPDPDGGLPTVSTFTPTPFEHGLFMVTCLQLPGVVLFGDSEEDVLMLAHLAIKEVLAGRRGS